jgi:hypothetical protein
MTWKLGVDANFETGGIEVPSFSGTVPGAKTWWAGGLRNYKIAQFPRTRRKLGLGVGVDAILRALRSHKEGACRAAR